MAKANSAFMKPRNISPELAVIVGPGPMPGTEVTKKIWEYIKSKNLQDPKDRRVIVADENLRKVFDGQESINMMQMAKYVSKHLS